MRQAATFGGAIAAGFVGFYLGLWALLAVMGLDGAGDLAFSTATTGVSGFLSGTTAALIGRLGATRVATFGVVSASGAIATGLGVAAFGGDAVWTGGAALLVAVAAALAATVSDRRDP